MAQATTNLVPNSSRLNIGGGLLGAATGGLGQLQAQNARTASIGSAPSSVSPTGQVTPSTYTIQSGDTLSGIASKYGLDTQQLAQSNSILDPNRIYAGQTLKLPGATPTTPTAQTTYPGLASSLLPQVGAAIPSGNKSAITGYSSSGQPIYTSAPPGSNLPAYTPPPGTQNVGADQQVVTQGTLGTGSPAATAATAATGGTTALNQTLGNLVGTTQGLLQGQQQVTTPFLKQNLDTIAAATAEEQQLTSGSYSGTAADYSGRLAQLENIKQAAQQNVNQAQGNLAQFGQIAAGGLGTAAGYLTPAQQFAQVGQGTTLVGGGGQPVLSTPVLGPVGTQTPYSVAPGAGTGAGAGTNTPYTAGYVQGQIQGGATVANMQQALGAARNISQQVVSDLAQNPSLNASPVAAINALNQWVNTQGIPSGPYVNFLNDLQEYANTIAPVLGVGGNTTDLKTTIAQNMIPVLASGGTVSDALNHLDQLAQTKIGGIQSTAQGQAGGATAGTTGGTVNVGGYSYKQNADGTYTYTGFAQ